jgi:hypothetical protein
MGIAPALLPTHQVWRNQRFSASLEPVPPARPFAGRESSIEMEKVTFILDAKEITKRRSAGSATSRRQSAKLMRKPMNDSAL